MNDVNEKNLFARGYRVYSRGEDGLGYSKYSDLSMQRCFQDAGGKRFYLNFHRFPAFNGRPEVWDASLTQNDPHMTFKQHFVRSIAQTEERAEAFWETVAEGRYYEEDEA